MRTSFLIAVTGCLLLLAFGVAWDSAAGSGVVSSSLQYIGELTAEPDPRPEEEKGICARILNAIAMLHHRQSTCR